MESGADNPSAPCTPTLEPPVKPCRSLEARLLALVTVAFGLLCASAVLVELGSAPEAEAITAQAA